MDGLERYISHESEFCATLNAFSSIWTGRAIRAMNCKGWLGMKLIGLCGLSTMLVVVPYSLLQSIASQGGGDGGSESDVAPSDVHCRPSKGELTSRLA